MLQPGCDRAARFVQVIVICVRGGWLAALQTRARAMRPGYCELRDIWSDKYHEGGTSCIMGI